MNLKVEMLLRAKAFENCVREDHIEIAELEGLYKNKKVTSKYKKPKEKALTARNNESDLSDTMIIVEEGIECNEQQEPTYNQLKRQKAERQKLKSELKM